MHFLPTTKEELKILGWDQLDIILVSGDAYIDHPSFGAAIIGRNLEAAGYRVGIIDQPDWTNLEDISRLGMPRLFFGVTAGNMDSMVNHYTAQKKLRHNDAYTPGGIYGKRPDRASIIYTNLIRQAFKGAVVVLGGVEASLRRIAHYDFWSDKIRNSILADAKANILVYGMGEKPILQIAAALASGKSIQDMDSIPGTVAYSKLPPEGSIVLPDSSKCVDKAVFREMTICFNDNFATEVLYQLNGGRYIKHNPPPAPMTTEELDKCYKASFSYLPHPKYQLDVPAYIQIKDSITSHRGCYGGCSFCAISLHQGRAVQSRTMGSIVEESRKLAAKKDFSGTISDVGGPTANMYGTKCSIDYPSACKRSSCLYPNICPNLVINHSEQLHLLDEVSKQRGVNKVFIASGIRHDMAIEDEQFIEALATKYTGGRLKLAPEHIVDKVLDAMHKPGIHLYERFCAKYQKVLKRKDIKRQIIPYIIIGHPGTEIKDAIELSTWLKKNNIRLEQVQEFTPTPMTISTCMYYTGLDYNTGNPIVVPKGHQIRLQKALVFWYDKKNANQIREALKK